MEGLPLLRRLHERDPSALREVVDGNARPLYRAARGLGFTHETAEDLVQDAFITFLETLDRFEGRAQVRTWLFGILFHKAQEQRRVATRVEPRDPADDVFESWFDARGQWVTPPTQPDCHFAAKQARAAIRGCLNGLTALQRYAFFLRQVEGCSGAEVSYILGESVTHVGVLLHRARVRLRDCLSRQGITP
jgi:RNA polymerase sigma-70 factor (ECF subfamily)